MDDSEYWRKVIALFNKGYAGIFNHQRGVVEKHEMERGVALEWIKASSLEFGCSFSGLEHGADPPDFTTIMNGQKVSVELVQFVNERHKKRSIKGESAYHGKLFQDMQWTKLRFLTELQRTIRKKEEQYLEAMIKIDMLVIHSSETWLSAGDVDSWLAAFEYSGFRNIQSVFLLLDYQPGWSQDHWPVFKVF